MKNKRIVIIGNSPVGQLLTLMLDDSYEVIRVRDCEEKWECVPFYANDIERGILKQFCSITNIPFETSNSNEVSIDLIYDEKKHFYCNSSFDSFQKKIKLNYPQHQEAIAQLFQDIKDVGEEWSAFIKNNFDVTTCKMKKSAKHVGMTVEQYLKKKELYNTDIRKILYTILPIRDVTFAVFAGYLYTQFFDNHILSKDIWKELCLLGGKLGSSSILYDLNRVIVEEEEKKNTGNLILNNIDSVIDLRCSDFIVQQADNTNKLVWGGFFFTDKLNENVIYYLEIKNGIYIRFWKSLYQPNRKGKRWQFELLAEKNRTLNAQKTAQLIRDKLREYFNIEIGIETNSVYSPDYFARYFDCSYGYMWAFNLRQSMNDPTNLYSKQKSSDIKGGYWGFAWFSAAFCLYNAIKKQVEWKGKYKLIQH